MSERKPKRPVVAKNAITAAPAPDGSERGELVLYTTEDGGAQFFLRAEGGTVWLSQLELAELFQTTKQNISLHIKNILAEGELSGPATVKEYLTVQSEGRRQVRRPLQHYNLDLIRLAFESGCRRPGFGTQSSSSSPFVMAVSLSTEK